MNKRNNQLGSAHIVIISILVVALLGLIGFVFWQNFIQNKDTATTNQSTTTATPAPTTYKTFTSANSSLTFQYPDNWATSEVTAPEGIVEVVTVKDSRGKTVAALQTNSQLGGACDYSQAPVYTTLDLSSTNIKATQPVFFGLTALTSTDGGYDVHYGLTDYYTKIETGTECPNVFFYSFDSGNDRLGGTAFGNDMVSTVHYESLQDVKNFIATDEYKTIKKMVSSLSY